MEQALTSVWGKLLELAPGRLTTEDHFFELGGNSFRMILLKSMLDQSLQINVDLNRLLLHPIFSEMVEVVRDALESNRGRHAAPWSPLVSLQPRGTARPFFCVHPSGGNVICYAGIAQGFGERSWPFYGLEAQGMIDDALHPLRTVEEMAALYVAAIRRVQLQGPYLLGGWSSGGIVAFEMARQLRRSGQSVDKVLMIDSPAPLPGRKVDLQALRTFFDEDYQRGTGRGPGAAGVDAGAWVDGVTGGPIRRTDMTGLLGREDNESGDMGRNRSPATAARRERIAARARAVAAPLRRRLNELTVSSLRSNYPQAVRRVAYSHPHGVL